MGLFSTKKKTYVSGYISRVRPDELIRDTTGLVALGAVVSNQDISEAIRIDAMAGTEASYKGFWRSAKKKYGLPEASISYRQPKKDKLALKIRTATGNAYPLDTDLVTIFHGPIDEDNFIKYELQDAKDYNVTTNILVHSTINYYLDSYTQGIGKYVISASRTKEVTTTITNRFYIYFSTVWRVKEESRTEESWIYDPLGTPGSSDSGWIEINDYAYDTVNDPWGLSLPPGGGAAFYHCHASLCDPVVSYTDVIESVSFDLLVTLPEVEETIIDEQTGEPIETYKFFWQVTYLYSGRTYLWVAVDEDITEEFFEVEDDIPELPVDFTEFAPVVPIRDDFADYTENNNPVNYDKSRRLLKQIGLSIDDLNFAISDGNDDIDKIADSYVTLGSPLASKYMDVLGYNYAFFNVLSTVNDAVVGTYGDIEDIPEVLEGSVRTSGAISLDVIFTGTYAQTISWQDIAVSTVTGTLTNEYEFSLTNSSSFFGISRTTYTIKKRLTPTTYSQIVVSGLSMEFFVYYSGEQGKAYNAEFKNSSSSTIDSLSEDDLSSVSQFVLPVNLELAKQAIRRDLETFFLRTTHVGLFSRIVVKIKWYQTGFFKVLLVIIAIIVFIYCAKCAAVIVEFGAATAAAIGITITTVAAAVAIAIVAYAVIGFALQKILVAALKAVGGNEFLENLIKIAYIVVNVIYFSGTGLARNLLTIGNAYLDTLKADIELASLELEELTLEAKALFQEVEELKKQEFMQDSNSYFYLEYVLGLKNQFSDPNISSQTNPEQYYVLANNPSTFYATKVSNFFNVSKRLPEPWEVIANQVV